MNGSIQDQLRDYADDVTSRSVAVDFDEVMRQRFSAESVQPAHPSERSTKAERKPWRTATAAAAAVLILIGGAALLAQTSGSDVDAGATPTTEPTSLSTVVPSQLTWSRATDDGTLADRVPFTDGMRDVTRGGPGLVAVGEGDDGAAVWTSADGITWSRLAFDDSVLGGGSTMWSVPVGSFGLVAVGGERGPEHESGDGDAAVWTSTDSVTWSRVPHDESVFGGEGEQQMVSVATGGPGLVAVGWDTSGGSPDAAVWTSADGLVWSRVPHDELVFGGEHDQTMSSVAVGGPGLVAVGADSFLDVDRGQLTNYDDVVSVAAVWTSIDGLTWDRVPHDEAILGGEGNQWMDSLASTALGLVAVGGDWSREGHHAAVWMSVDGTTWSRIPNNGSVFGGEHDQLMSGVTQIGSGVIAVGQAWASSDSGSFTGHDSAASVWVSDDGLTWTWMGYDEAVFGSEDNTTSLLSDGPVYTESRQFMTSVIATHWGAVAVGADWAGPSHGAAVWIATEQE
ncbi:MAG: hypothetical protein ACR2N7_12950 [Acidimicrobiia bacterium]